MSGCCARHVRTRETWPCAMRDEMDRAWYTIGDVATLYGVAEWRVRRVVDDLGVEIPRAGRYRLVPSSCLGRIAVALAERGWLADQPVEQIAEGLPA